MLILVSPAKKLDFKAPPPIAEYSVPEFLDQAQVLVKTAQDLEPEELSSLMGISDQLAMLNFERFQQWHPARKPQDDARQAVLAFQGDVYQGLQAQNFSADDFHFAQRHLRILSGLYGLLRPLDLICPYRLEMGLALANARGPDIYRFWGERISDGINTQLRDADEPPVVINLASREYFKAVQPERLQAEVWTPVFKEKRNGRYRIISFSAKKARGRMSAWLIQNRVRKPDNIREFNQDGYRWSRTLSSGRELVFTRAPKD